MKFKSVAIALLIVLAMVVIFDWATTATDFEADIIKGPVTTLFETEDWSTLTPEDFDAMVADSHDIFGDTTPGSICASYSALVTHYVEHVGETMIADDRLHGEISFLLFHQLPPYEWRCRNQL